MDGVTLHLADCLDVLPTLPANSIALSVWSPPYFVGKSYEKHLSFEGWKALLRDVIAEHSGGLQAGAFLVVNIADILCFPDPNLPRIRAENLNGHRLPVTRGDIVRVLQDHPTYDRYKLAAALGVSEQTIDRRMKNNNVRGGKYNTQTRVKLVGGMLEEMAYAANLYLYDRRAWVKDPCWQNSKWHTNSYRAVDEFEYLYIFWKPGITKVDRERLDKEEWIEWGSRAVWAFASVRSNDDHEAKFPVELPRRVIRLFTDPEDIVLDCFVGSGTTGVACVETGRRFIGIEKQADYFAIAERRIAAAQPCLPEAR